MLYLFWDYIRILCGIQHLIVFYNNFNNLCYLDLNCVFIAYLNVKVLTLYERRYFV